MGRALRLYGGDGPERVSRDQDDEKKEDNLPASSNHLSHLGSRRVPRDI